MVAEKITGWVAWDTLSFKETLWSFSQSINNETKRKLTHKNSSPLEVVPRVS